MYTGGVELARLADARCSIFDRVLLFNIADLWERYIYQNLHFEQIHYQLTCWTGGKSAVIARFCRPNNIEVDTLSVGAAPSASEFCTLNIPGLRSEACYDDVSGSS